MKRKDSEDPRLQGRAVAPARLMVRDPIDIVLDPRGMYGPSVVSYLEPDAKKTTVAAVVATLKVYSSLVCVPNWDKGGNGTWVRTFEKKTVMPMVLRALLPSTRPCREHEGTSS